MEIIFSISSHKKSILRILRYGKDFYIINLKSIGSVNTDNKVVATTNTAA